VDVVRRRSIIVHIGRAVAVGIRAIGAIGLRLARLCLAGNLLLLILVALLPTRIRHPAGLLSPSPTLASSPSSATPTSRCAPAPTSSSHPCLLLLPPTHKLLLLRLLSCSGALLSLNLRKALRRTHGGPRGRIPLLLLDSEEGERLRRSSRGCRDGRARGRGCVCRWC
jgi:hypothetical protein